MGNRWGQTRFLQENVSVPVCSVNPRRPDRPRATPNPSSGLPPCSRQDEPLRMSRLPWDGFASNRWSRELEDPESARTDGSVAWSNSSAVVGKSVAHKKRTVAPMQHFIGLPGRTAGMGFASTMLLAAEIDRHSLSRISAVTADEGSPARAMRYGRRASESADGLASEEKHAGEELLDGLSISFLPWRLGDGASRLGSKQGGQPVR
jgi:hypothetical protein